MMKIIKKEPLEKSSILEFTNIVDFKLPVDFIDFFAESDGAEIFTDSGNYIVLWPLTEMIQLNIDYNVNEYASDYFIFGSDGGDMAYCIQKETGNIFEIPFIGMSNDEAIFNSKSLYELFSI